MDTTEILYDVTDGVATITLNRPDKLNAWTPTMNGEVKAAMHAASDDDAVKIIVMTGAGRGFCAGADMNNLSNLAEGERREVVDPPFDENAPEHFKKPNAYFPAVPKPIIGAINGPCAGLGMVYALYTDIRFASDAAVFSTAFSRRGLIAEYGAAWLLPRLVGMANAMDLLLSARRVTGQEAADIGLVNRVIPHGEFMDQVMEYASDLAANVSPRSTRVMKRQMWEAQFLELGPALDIAIKDMGESLQSDDFKEGVAHFVEKRAANFTGR